MNNVCPIAPDWEWSTAEGSRKFDRLADRLSTFRETLEWLESAETLTLRLRESRALIRENDAATGASGAAEL